MRDTDIEYIRDLRDEFGLNENQQIVTLIGNLKSDEDEDNEQKE